MHLYIWKGKSDSMPFYLREMQLYKRLCPVISLFLEKRQFQKIQENSQHFATFGRVSALLLWPFHSLQNSWVDPCPFSSFEERKWLAFFVMFNAFKFLYSR